LEGNVIFSPVSDPVLFSLSAH